MLLAKPAPKAGCHPPHRVIFGPMMWLHHATSLCWSLDADHHPVPGAIATPADKPVVAGLPGTVAGGHIAPRCTGAQPPEDAVDDLAVVPPLLATMPIFRQQRHEPAPRRVR